MPRRKRYVPPVVASATMTNMNTVRRSDYLTHKATFPDGRSYFLREHVSQKSLDAQHQARSKLEESMERPLFDKPLGKRRLVLYEAGGKDFVLELKNIKDMDLAESRTRRKGRLLGKIINVISRLHARAYVEHAHPHEGNLVIYLRKGKKRIRLIDFKYAVKRDPDWRSAISVLNAFKADYSSLNRVFFLLGLTPQPIRLKAFAGIVRKYPMAEENKRELLKLISSDIIPYYPSSYPGSVREKEW